MLVERLNLKRTSRAWQIAVVTGDSAHSGILGLIVISQQLGDYYRALSNISTSCRLTPFVALNFPFIEQFHSFVQIK
jgi:hypothetical protein